MKIGQENPSQTKEIIRAAERFIQAQQYDLALKELVTAQRIDPGNAYISAIAERIHHLITAEQQTSRYLSVTVGTGFDRGIKPDPVPEADPLERQVQNLTLSASSYLRRGAYETAFESLFNAYLLDPCSPTVVESERTLLPAIEMMRRRTYAPPAGDRRQTPPSSKRPQVPAPAPASESEQSRLQELMRKKEEERANHERAMWRDASAPPRATDPTQPTEEPAASTAESTAATETAPAESGSRRFFSRFRRKKQEPAVSELQDH
jgi:hypothetical protein